jgi:Mg2+ and Co2+ transporter CorA
MRTELQKTAADKNELFTRFQATQSQSQEQQKSQIKDLTAKLDAALSETSRLKALTDQLA